MTDEPDDAALAAFEAAVAAGRPADALLEQAVAFRDRLSRGPEPLLRLFDTAAALDPGKGRATLVDADSLCAAVVTPRGRSCWVDPRFRAIVGDPGASPVCVQLALGIADGGRTAGVVATSGHGAVVVGAQAAERRWAWPLSPGAAAALVRSNDAVLLLLFAPSRSIDLMLNAGRALGLSDREARLVEALLQAPSLLVAARRIGMGDATARDALASACRKAGVRGSSRLVDRILDLSGAPSGAGAAGALAGVLGLTPAEARVADALIVDESAKVAALTLGLSTETIKSYRKRIFSKTGINRARDLRRLVAEAAGFDHMATNAETPLEHGATADRLKLIVKADGRRVALIDYGPASGRLLLAMHGYTVGRRLPPPLVAALQAAGWRPVVPQRPGFGLTDPAAGDYLATAADDLGAVMDRLGERRVVILARDGGAATALALAVASPGRLSAAVLLNPRAPRDSPRDPSSAHAVSALSRLLLDHPLIINAVGEMTRRQTDSAIVRSLLRRMGSTLEVDRVTGERPEVLDHLVTDFQAMLARSARGLIDELRLYADGWRIPQLPEGCVWRLAYSAVAYPDPDVTAWTHLPGLTRRSIHGAGLLAGYSHPAEVAALLEGL